MFFLQIFFFLAKTNLVTTQQRATATATNNDYDDDDNADDDDDNDNDDDGDDDNDDDNGKILSSKGIFVFRIPFPFLSSLSFLHQIFSLINSLSVIVTNVKRSEKKRINYYWI